MRRIICTSTGSGKWRRSALRGRRTSPLISTEPDRRIIKVHQDGSGGRPLVRLATNLPRTMLSASDAAKVQQPYSLGVKCSHGVCCRLEPSCLRQPDNFKAPIRLGMDGSHMAATLYHLAHVKPPQQSNGTTADEWSARVYADIANRLSRIARRCPTGVD